MVRTSEHMRAVRPLLPQAVVATIGVAILPVVVVFAVLSAGMPEPQVLLATALGLALSCGAAAVGTALWIKRPESVDVAFGELMLWRFFRRHRAEQTIEEGVDTLRLAPDGTPTAPLEAGAHFEVLQKLTEALETKDPYTHGHSRRVERHVYRTAMAMGLARREIEELRLAAAVHDVGKIRVPDRVLRKPGSLTLEERQVVREHVTVGAALVAEADVPRVTQAVLHHHECWNGTGYPDHLAHGDIPLFARIIAVADAYDAMTSARPYKAGVGRRAAIDALREGAGEQFDPHIVEAFISTLPTALPAAGALLIFAAPAGVARRTVAWLKTSASGSVASAAGTAGLLIAIGASAITSPVDAPSRRSGVSVVQRPAAVTEALTEDADKLGPRVLGIRVGEGDERTRGDRTNAVRARNDDAAGGGNARANGNGRRNGNAGGAGNAAGSAGNAGGNGSGSGDGEGSSESAAESEKPEPKEPDDPVEPEETDDVEADDDSDSSSGGDPQPDRGADCDHDEDSDGDSVDEGKGHDRHCGGG